MVSTMVNTNLTLKQQKTKFRPSLSGHDIKSMMKRFSCNFTKTESAGVSKKTQEKKYYSLKSI